MPKRAAGTVNSGTCKMTSSTRLADGCPNRPSSRFAPLPNIYHPRVLNVLLQLRNVTQTSVTLEWPPLELATAKLRSLDIHRNGARLATIPSPLQNTSTKLSGLELDHEYTFQLFLRTSAGVFPSNTIPVRTHTMQNTSGISVCFGTIQDPVLLEHAKLALEEMGARYSDRIQIDTTHFVCTTPAATSAGASAAGNVQSGPGVEYQRALQLSIPVVLPHWIMACHSERKMVPIASYYLGASNVPMNTPPFTRPQSMSGVPLAKSPTRPLSGAGVGSTKDAAANRAANRASMPPMSRSESLNVARPLSPRSPENQARSLPAFQEAEEPTSEGEEDGEPSIPPTTPGGSSKAPVAAKTAQPSLAPASAKEEGKEEENASDPKNHLRKGTMDKNFRFPPGAGSPTPPPAVPALPNATKTAEATAPAVPELTVSPVPPEEAHVVAPSSIDVPPPPAPEKEERERRASVGAVSEDEDLGATEEIPL
jgi:hypothetical protein